MANHLTLGLRFPKSQARTLRNVADRLRSERLVGVDIGLFDKAAESAALGEPLVVACSSREEIERMAHGFTLWGVARPAIDELRG